MPLDNTPAFRYLSEVSVGPLTVLSLDDVRYGVMGYDTEPCL
jgi:hypothetical protein